MTYDENDDYNGPDVHRRGPFLFMAALVGVILVAGFGAAASDARADPTQTVLPADGVQSITRDGDLWTVTTDGAPSEVKLLSPRNEVLCGVNYGITCTTVTTFTSTGDCAFIQVDGLPGFNSSDPYICLGGTPSSSPSPTAPPVSSDPPVSVPPTTTPYEPTSPPSTEVPTTTPTSSPTSTPEPSSNPTPVPSPTAALTSAAPSAPPPSPDSASTGGHGLTTSSMVAHSGSGARDRLADTGMDATPALIVFALFVILTGVMTLWGRRKGLERFGSES